MTRDQDRLLMPGTNFLPHAIRRPRRHEGGAANARALDAENCRGYFRSFHGALEGTGNNKIRMNAGAPRLRQYRAQLSLTLGSQSPFGVASTGRNILGDAVPQDVDSHDSAFPCANQITGGKQRGAGDADELNGNMVERLHRGEVRPLL